MTEITTSIDKITEDVNFLESKLPEYKTELLYKIGFLLVGKIKQKIVDKQLVATGRYLNSIQATVLNENNLLVSDGVFYGIYLEVGTGIYGPKATPILPKKAKVLHFKLKTGEGVFARQVKGIPPQSVFEESLEESIPEIEQRVADFFEKITKEAM